MKLITKEIENKLLKNPLYSHDGEGTSANVIVKFFDSCGTGTWLVTEGSKEDNGDWLFFGYCYIHCWEWGYFRLSDIESINKMSGFQRIQRDMYSRGTVEELVNQ